MDYIISKGGVCVNKRTSKLPLPLIANILIMATILLVLIVGWVSRVQLLNPAVPISSLIILTVLMSIGHIIMFNATKGGSFRVRKIAAFEAIEEGIARAVEMGRPVHMTIGFGTMSTAMAPQYIAGLGVLSHVAKLCGKYGAKLIVTLGVPEAIPIVEEIVREGYYSAGRPELFSPTYNVRYLTNQQFAFASAVQATLVRENVGTNIAVGPFWAEALMFMESGNKINAFQIAGTAREVQIPSFVLTADYAFIGEEIFVAGALASGDKLILSSIRGQDVGKLITILLIVLGIMMLALGIKSSTWLELTWKLG